MSEASTYHHNGIDDDAVYAYQEETTFTPSGPYAGKKNPSVSVRHEWFLRPVVQGPMTIEEWADRKRLEDNLRKHAAWSGPEYEEFIEHTCWRRC